jgi:hypothetical protein
MQWCEDCDSAHTAAISTVVSLTANFVLLPAKPLWAENRKGKRCYQAKTVKKSDITYVQML